MLWAVFIVIVALVLVLLIEPLFRAQKVAGHLDEEDYLAAQISDIERDRAAGLISAEEAESASAEAITARCDWPDGQADQRSAGRCCFSRRVCNLFHPGQSRAGNH